MNHTGQTMYDGTEDSRVRIRNWQRETYDDPGEPFMVQAHPGISDEEFELFTGQTLVRHPNGSFSVLQEATSVEPE